MATFQQDYQAWVGRGGTGISPDPANYPETGQGQAKLAQQQAAQQAIQQSNQATAQYPYLAGAQNTTPAAAPSTPAAPPASALPPAVNFPGLVAPPPGASMTPPPPTGGVYNGLPGAVANANPGVPAGTQAGPGTTAGPTTPTPPPTPTPGAGAPGAGAGTPTLPNQPPVGPPTAPPPATGAPTQLAGTGASAALFKLYQQTHPGVQVNTPQEQQAFNDWTGQITSQFGVQDWEHLPADFATRFNPNGTSPLPPGSPASPATNIPASVDLNSLVIPPTTGNFSQGQVGAQSGAYGSTGTTEQTQQGQQSTAAGTTSAQTGVQTSSQTGQTAGTTTGQNAQQTAGTSAQQTAGTAATTGQTTQSTTPTSPINFNALLQQQANTAGTTDQSRNAFLNDVMNTGGQQFGSQVDQAVRNSLTGPQMTGAGDSARARAAGYAGAEIGRQNLGERLQATSALAGPTATNTAVQGTQPLFGSATTGQTAQQQQTAGTTTGATTGMTAGTTAQQQQGTTAQQGTNTNATTGATQSLSNTLDFQKLLGKESQAGTATGSSAAAAAGTVPQGQPVQTGGCVVCSAYCSLGLMNPGAIRRAVRWKLSTDDYAISIDGYMLYGPALARAVMRNGLFARLFRPLARGILYHEVHLSAPTRLRPRVIPRILHSIFNHGSKPVGLFARVIGRRGVRCPRVSEMLASNNLLFPL